MRMTGQRLMQRKGNLGVKARSKKRQRESEKGSLDRVQIRTNKGLSFLFWLSSSPYMPISERVKPQFLVLQHPERTFGTTLLRWKQIPDMKSMLKSLKRAHNVSRKWRGMAVLNYNRYRHVRAADSDMVLNHPPCTLGVR